MRSASARSASHQCKVEAAALRSCCGSLLAPSESDASWSAIEYTRPAMRPHASEHGRDCRGDHDGGDRGDGPQLAEVEAISRAICVSSCRTWDMHTSLGVFTDETRVSPPVLLISPWSGSLRVAKKTRHGFCRSNGEA